MDDLQELADALASAKAGDTTDESTADDAAPADGAETAPAVDVVDDSPGGDPEDAATVDAGDESGGDHEPDEVEFKRIQDAQRAMHAAKQEAKDLRERLERMESGDESDDDVEYGPVPTVEQIGEALGKDSKLAAATYHEALARPDVDVVMPNLIAATQGFDPALAESMRIEYAKWSIASAAQADERHQQFVIDAAREGSQEFYNAKDDAAQHTEAIQGLLGHPQNTIFHEMLESGDPGRVYLAHELAYHVARSLAMDNPDAAKPAAAAVPPPASDADRAGARALESGKGSTRAAAADDGGKSDPLAGLTDALKHLQAAG